MGQNDGRQNGERQGSATDSTALLEKLTETMGSVAAILAKLQEGQIDDTQRLALAELTKIADPRGASHKRWIAADETRRSMHAKVESDLLAGPITFEVSLEANPTRRVGAETGYHAIEKYRAYMGIRETGKGFKVEQIEPPLPKNESADSQSRHGTMAKAA